MARNLRHILICTAILLITPTALWAQNSDDRDKRIAELEQRVQRLEQKVAELSGQKQNEAAGKAPREVIDAHARKARERMAQDRKKYSVEQLREAENLYQVANNNWRTPAAKESLEKMVGKFPDVNRTGCALLYLGQYSAGAEREKYLKQAIEHGDCYYGDGVQVGALARYYLGAYYQENNQPDKAKQLFDEVLQQYPNAISHGGDLLSEGIKRITASKPD
jgi:tetratricopeptide (TPR) repeat protein